MGIIIRTFVEPVLDRFERPSHLREGLSGQYVKDCASLANAKIFGEWNMAEIETLAQAAQADLLSRYQFSKWPAIAEFVRSMETVVGIAMDRKNKLAAEAAKADRIEHHAESASIDGWRARRMTWKGANRSDVDRMVDLIADEKMRERMRQFGYKAIESAGRL